MVCLIKDAKIKDSGLGCIDVSIDLRLYYDLEGEDKYGNHFPRYIIVK